MINELRQRMAEADAVLVFAGAGMSADSGLPTYRSKEGFWNDYPLYRELGRDYIAMASPHGFGSDPSFAWGFFAHQHMLYSQATVHDGYRMLLNYLESKEDYFVVTTNVEGMFLRAGYPNEKLHEAHGSIHRLQCAVPCNKAIWSFGDQGIQVKKSTMRAIGSLPHCPHCAAIARPNIFMYGDTEESYVWEEAEKSAILFRQWMRKYQSQKVLLLEIGVGAEGMKEHVVRYHKRFQDAFLIRINPELEANYTETAAHLPISTIEALKGLLV